MNQVRSISNLSEKELELGILDIQDSWHQEYKNKAYIYFGNLSALLTEADILTIFSQFGNPVDLRLVYDKQTEVSRGFGYLKYEDQRSTVLAVDNFNGTKILDRYVKVDHAFYKPSERVEDQQYQQVMSEELSRDFQIPIEKQQTATATPGLVNLSTEETSNDEETGDPMDNLLKSDLLLPYNATEDEGKEGTRNTDEDDELADPMAGLL